MSPAGVITALHFLRPWWLCALLFLPLLAWGWRRRQRARSPWRDVVDPHLLPRLLDEKGGRRGRFGFWLAILAYALVVLALAGPSWRQSTQPLWQERTPVVVAIDLSGAMLAGDLPPSRLAQARAKLATLLRERNGGQVGLVAFAADAFTVAPLTDDAANIALYLDALQPDVMPRDGQRPHAAIAWSVQLLERAGAMRGDIVLLTDHADAAAMEAAADAAGRGFRVSAIGLGTAAGAAYRHADGGLSRTRLDAGSLRRMAARGNGRYVAISSDDSDLRALGLLDRSSMDAVGGGASGLAWRDEGYWLLPPLMLLALFAFRRRGAGALVLLLVCVGVPHGRAHAADLWRRADQVEHARLQRGNEAYREGDFPSAARDYAGIDSATAHYNRGNALARAGQYPEAIDAYDRALRLQPGMADAIANRRAVEAAMKRQPQGGAQQDGRQKQGGQGEGRSGPPQSSAQPDGAQSANAKSPPQQSRQQQAAKKPAQDAAQPADASPQDAQAQQDADRAQRDRMQRALQEQTRAGRQASAGEPREDETPEQRERRLANEAWLRRVPDDPGGLLRAKFRLEYERRRAQGRTGE